MYYRLSPPPPPLPQEPRTHVDAATEKALASAAKADEQDFWELPRRIIWVAATFLLLLFLLLLTSGFQDSTTEVSRVVDGDTFLLNDGRYVRLIGIDTPEHERCFAAEATAYMRVAIRSNNRRVR